MTPFRASPGFTETWQHFDFAIDDGVATLTFNRPDKLNALTSPPNSARFAVRTSFVNSKVLPCPPSPR